MFKNKKGFSDVIAMTIIGGILGSLFILGVFVWKEIEIVNTLNQVKQVFNKVVDVEKEEIIDNKESEWLTYNNASYGFSFEYPSDWRVITDSGNNYDKSIISIINPNMDTSNFYDFSVYSYLSVIDLPENTSGAFTIDEFVDNNPSMTKIGNIDLDGIKATDAIWGGNSSSYIILAKNGQRIYMLEFDNVFDANKLSDTKKKILSTFKFLDNNLELADRYNILVEQNNFKYSSYEDAVNAFQDLAGTSLITPTKIDLYVPGKYPREDGDLYFIGSGTIDLEKNKCIKGYFNLVTGEGKSWEDVCVIYN